MAAVKEVQLKMNEEKGKEMRDDLEKLEKDLEAADIRATEAEKKEDAMYQDFQLDMKRKLDEHMSTVRGGAGATAGIEHRLYSSHVQQTTDLIKLKQAEVMKMNKVVREVSRVISGEWKPVFEYLMAAQMSKPEIKTLIIRIEKQNKPLMQAYKALMTWKEVKEESLGLTHLADALRINGKTDLADYVLDAIDCEGETFNQLKVPGENGEDGKPAAKPASTSGFLDDRKFLQLAKKIGGDWQTVANTLGLAEEDVTEIMEAEGATYQGAFKMLWTWRDRTLELDQDDCEVLKEALKACGKEDIANLV